jgi:hypothetical protein
MAQDRIAEQVAGVVACSNPKGFQLAGRDGWLNISKFAGGVEVPAKGARIVAGLDRAGFVREVEITSTRVETPAATVSPMGELTPGPIDRETSIRRQAVLNTAVNILSTTGAVELGDVLATAELLEQWVLR